MLQIALCLLALALAGAARAENAAEETSLRLQATWIGQTKRPFSAPYTGTNSLVPPRDSGTVA
jgi:hypothetical protein